MHQDISVNRTGVLEPSGDIDLIVRYRARNHPYMHVGAVIKLDEDDLVYDASGDTISTEHEDLDEDLREPQWLVCWISKLSRDAQFEYMNNGQDTAAGLQCVQAIVWGR